jgi:hypothetical protein
VFLSLCFDDRKMGDRKMRKEGIERSVPAARRANLIEQTP